MNGWLVNICGGGGWECGDGCDDGCVGGDGLIVELGKKPGGIGPPDKPSEGGI
jgi:hypothetical protein